MKYFYCVLVILFVFQHYLAASSVIYMDRQCTIISDYTCTPDMGLNEYHPNIHEDERELTVLSVNEGDILQVACFKNTNFRSVFRRFDVHNPSKKDFTGMPAKCVNTSKEYGVEFLDGTTLWPYLPPDAQVIGSTEWPYEMRWKRVYKNYYYLVVYRTRRNVIFEHLVTEKNGLDISPYLGESSVEKVLPKFGAVWLGDTVQVSGSSDLPRITLNIIREKDLPPDFPKGLVRWIP